MEYLEYFLFFGGGALLAVVFMVLAIAKIQQRIWTIAFAMLAAGCLIGQRGFWKAAAEMGRATDGAFNPFADEAFSSKYQIVIGLCVGWVVVFFAIRVVQSTTSGKNGKDKRFASPRPQSPI